MKKYNVVIMYTGFFDYDVEAESLQEAEEAAYELYSAVPDEQFSYNITECETYSIYEVDENGDKVTKAFELDDIDN